MIARLYNLWQLLKSNLWFVPAFMCVIYCAFTLSLYLLEINYFNDFELPPGPFFTGTAGDAKDVSLTLLSSMITMATLAISVTMVALSLAASQLGPRLIKAFMSDYKTKYFIGLFFGAVIASFTLTMILYDAAPKAVSPRITITAVFSLCFMNLFILLAFFHHVAQSCIADNIIIKVANDLRRSLNRLTNEEDHSAHDDENIEAQWPKDFESNSSSFYFEKSGYVQNIDYKHIMRLARDNDLIIEIGFKAGHFLVEGESGVRVYPAHRMNNDISCSLRDSFIIGTSRTATQDIEYSIRHLVEIAIRALSPGINDSFTAISVLDHLSESMAALFKKEMVSEWMTDDHGDLRVQAKQSTEADIIFSAFDQIRLSGRQMPHILFHLLDKIEILSALSTTSRQKKGLKEQLKAITHDFQNLKKIVLDVESQQKRCQQILETLSPA